MIARLDHLERFSLLRIHTHEQECADGVCPDYLQRISQCLCSSCCKVFFSNACVQCTCIRRHCFPPPPYATYTFLANILRQIIIFTQCWYNHAVGFFNVRNGHQQPYHGCLQPKTHKVVSIFFWIILNKTFFFWGFVQNNSWLSQYYFGSCWVRININKSIAHYVSLCSCSLCFFCLCNHLKN